MLAVTEQGDTELHLTLSLYPSPTFALTLNHESQVQNIESKVQNIESKVQSIASHQEFLAEQIDQLQTAQAQNEVRHTDYHIQTRARTHTHTQHTRMRVHCARVR